MPATSITSWARREADGVGSDCIYGGSLAAGNDTGCQQTTAWGLDVGYEHYWTPQWHQSLVFNGMWEKYGTGTGSANAMLCVGEGLGTGAGTTAVAAAGCNNNWDVWAVGSRLQWDVTKGLYVGVEAVYEHLDSAQTGLARQCVDAGDHASELRRDYLGERVELGSSRCACTRTSCPDRLTGVYSRIAGEPPGDWR